MTTRAQQIADQVKALPIEKRDGRKTWDARRTGDASQLKKGLRPLCLDSGVSVPVPGSSLQYPNGLQAFEGLLGQRIYVR